MTFLPPGIIDAREEFARRFLALACAHGVDAGTYLHLPGNVSLSGHPLAPRGDSRSPALTMIVPGLLGDSVRSLVAPFMCAQVRLTECGYDTEVAWVNGRAGCARNAASLRVQVLRAADRQGGPINLIGYSKGCTDSLHMLGAYSDTHPAVGSLVSLGGIVSGTPLADSALPWLRLLLQYLPLPGVPVGDGLAIADLAPALRRHWLAEHPLPTRVRYGSVLAAPSPERISRVLKASYRRLAKVSTANDSQVIDIDALLPRGELLAIVNADHWALALPIAERHAWLGRWLVDRNVFPRGILLQAIIDHMSNGSVTESAKNPNSAMVHDHHAVAPEGYNYHAD
jgi:hypothetical protein